MSLTIKWIGSPNYIKGRGGYKPEAVVIHIMDGSLVGADSWFKNTASQVSAHYGIGQNGEIHQYVDEADQAWHAGRVYNPSWTSIKRSSAYINPNLYTIGIEHEGKADSAWSDVMYQTSINLVRDICTRWSIPIDRDHIVGHREIYARKTCPGSVVNLDELVELAKKAALADEHYNFISQSGSVTTSYKLNIRKDAPTTTADIAKTVPAGTVLAYIGWTSNGQSVNGNAHWYKTTEGYYFWAGGTEKQTPGI